MSPLPCHLLKTSAVAPASSPPEAAGLSDAPSPALSPGAGYRHGPVGPTLCHRPLGGLSLSGSSPVALIRSLLPGPPARTHWPRGIAHCLDSPGRGQPWPWTAGGGGSEMQATQGRASNPGEHFPSVSSCLLSACPASSLGTREAGLCHPKVQC